MVVSRSLGQRDGPIREEEKEFSMQEMRRAVNAVKSGKAEGPDGIKSDYVRNLRMLPEEAMKVLLDIFNYGWERQWIPQSWRSAIIVPIAKQGKPAEVMSSYRPRALTSHIGKLIERLIVQRLGALHERGNFYSSAQSGFRRGRST